MQQVVEVLLGLGGAVWADLRTCPGHSVSHFSRWADAFFRAFRHLKRTSFSVLRMIFSTSHSHSWIHTDNV